MRNTSSGASFWRTKTRQRDKSAVLTRNDGFSVVDATSEMVPASTTGRNCEREGSVSRCASARGA